jgi:hypothetical protein
MNQMYSPEVTNRIHQLRAKEKEGTLTMEDMKEAVIKIREGRFNASQQATKAKPKGPVRSAEQLLDELDNM